MEDVAGSLRSPGADAPRGRWLTPEQYAKTAELELEYVKKLIKKGVRRKSCPKRIDERDLERFSTKRVRIFYTAPNIAGVRRPRLVDR
jgi:hypothetical protein